MSGPAMRRMGVASPKTISSEREKFRIDGINSLLGSRFNDRALEVQYVEAVTLPNILECARSLGIVVVLVQLSSWLTSDAAHQFSPAFFVDLGMRICILALAFYSFKLQSKKMCQLAAIAFYIFDYATPLFKDIFRFETCDTGYHLLRYLQGLDPNCSVLSTSTTLRYLVTTSFMANLLMDQRDILIMGVVIHLITLYGLWTSPIIGEYASVRSVVKDTRLEKEGYYYVQDVLVRFLLLSVCWVYQLIRKSYMVKNQRKKFIDDLREREASQKLFRVLEGMVPAHVIPPMVAEIDSVIAEPVSCASILFVMIVDFDVFARQKSPDGLLRFLNNHFSEMDRMCHKHKVTKIETVSEEYVAAVGVVPEDVQLAEEFGHMKLLDHLASAAKDIFATGSEGVQFKMGMHTGPVVAGVIGQKLPRFRLFGDTINTAARMMQKGVSGELQFGQETKALLPSTITCTFRGKVEMKGKGLVDTYLIDHPRRRGNALAATLPLKEKVETIGETKGSASSSVGTTVLVPSAAAPVKKRVVVVSAPEGGGSDGYDSDEFSSDSETASGLPESNKQRRDSTVMVQTVTRKLSANFAASPTMKSVAVSRDNRRRFELMQQQIDEYRRRSTGVADSSQTTYRYLLNKLGLDLTAMSQEVEDQWLQIFHEASVAKKFDAKIERCLCAVSCFSMIITFYCKSRGCSAREFLAGTWLIAVSLCLMWMCAAQARWFITKPRRMHSILVVSVCVWYMCFILACQKLNQETTTGVVQTFLPTNCTFVSSDDPDVFGLDPFCTSAWKSLISSVGANRREIPWGLIAYCLYLRTTITFNMEHSSSVRILLVTTLFSLYLRWTRQGALGYPVDTDEILLAYVSSAIMVVRISCTVDFTSRSRFESRRHLASTSARVESILNTLMPPRVIEVLQELAPSSPAPSHLYKQSSVAQSDLCGFTKLASTRQPREVVEFIGQIFGLFDELTTEYEVYKVETVGDAYIAGQAGWPLTQRNAPVSVVLFGLEMIRAVHLWAKERGWDVSCRVGVHTGPCIGGIVGTEMMRYHLFGDSMHVLELMESTSLKGRVQVSTACQEAVLRQMAIEGKKSRDMLIFEERREADLSTSKGDAVNYSECGGPTYLVRRTGTASWKVRGVM
eukprot:TRINITY_DN13703_c0_g1_i1.p1 TRINITY_DN13703_c0_g1~~TRINITY_DN13703_c0_g1_i1.p1  ORF type:complete len:1132 (-),score=134.37 TRINITY_DN13703_c0_g1_i1:348-3743(-)